MDYFKHNNFDLVRLLAATQVAMLHSMEHLEVPVGRYELLIAYVPGVPAFFFISGFLISASWERNPDIRTFFANRFLRIFPGLWAATLLAAATLLVFGSGVDLRGNLPTFGLWFFTQSTIFQAWTPDFLRGYGVGAVNGSLWTIAVELSFYAFIPVLYLVFRSFGRATAILIAYSGEAGPPFRSKPALIPADGGPVVKRRVNCRRWRCCRQCPLAREVADGFPLTVLCRRIESPLSTSR
jgi:peptidoglycan/LPS O-acetylase OafA/YrhL